MYRSQVKRIIEVQRFWVLGSEVHSLALQAFGFVNTSTRQVGGLSGVRPADDLRSLPPREGGQSDLKRNFVLG
jgi:hypothetical protein